MLLSLVLRLQLSALVILWRVDVGVLQRIRSCLKPNLNRVQTRRLGIRDGLKCNYVSAASFARSDTNLEACDTEAAEVIREAELRSLPWPDVESGDGDEDDPRYVDMLNTGGFISYLNY